MMNSTNNLDTIPFAYLDHCSICVRSRCISVTTRFLYGTLLCKQLFGTPYATAHRQHPYNVQGVQGETAIAQPLPNDQLQDAHDSQTPGKAYNMRVVIFSLPDAKRKTHGH